MQDYINYRKSISHELISIKDRVRYIIGGQHWGEEGRYKEVILMDVLRKHLPKTVSVGTGFIMGENALSSQIDIIIYRNDFPLLFQQADFVIVPPEAVLGIIEVKSSADNTTKINEAIDKLSRNADLVSDNVFTGIFAYDGPLNICNSLRDTLSQSRGKVKYLCLGSKLYLMYWYKPLNDLRTPISHYRIYQMEDLAFGYFIANLVHDVYHFTTGNAIPSSLTRMLYPIREGKEAYRLQGSEIICQDD